MSNSFGSPTDGLLSTLTAPNIPPKDNTDQRWLFNPNQPQDSQSSTATLVNTESSNETQASSFGSSLGLLSTSSTTVPSTSGGVDALAASIESQFGKPSHLLQGREDPENLQEGLSFGASTNEPLSSGFGSHDPFTSASQDEDLPDPADIFQNYVPRHRETTSVAAEPDTRGLNTESRRSRPPGTFERMPVRATTYDGRSLLIKRWSRVATSPQQHQPHSRDSSKMANLLHVPIHRLMEDLSVAAASELLDPPSALSSLSLDPDKEQNISNKSRAIEETLWVDRYRPRQFTDLLGNERVARETLAWVKHWDWCVFGRNGRGKTAAGGGDTGASAMANRKRTREGEVNNDQNVPKDEFRRPREKILLLSGPPGLGKTTMAHVIAKQAGYDVLEINASDARSAQIIDDRIQPALESGSAIGSSRPVLIVIDEIDGATGGSDNSSGFIIRLLQLIQDKPQKKGQRSSKSKAPSSRPLLRPIICICNDPYAASLAKLRPLAFHLRFARPADVQTVRRLKEVCETERMAVEGRALSVLVGAARGDLRGCLNTLQFIKARSETVTESIVRAATVGMKEAETSVLSVLNSLFPPIPKSKVKELGLTEEEEARYTGRLAHQIESSDQITKIATGCFAHYPNLQKHDTTLKRYNKAMHWLLTHDTFSSAMYNAGEYALGPYLPFSLVAFFPLFQERGGPKVERDQADWENHLVTKTNEEIYKNLAKCMHAASARHAGAYRHLASEHVMQLELAPLLNRIISPPLRPVNKQVIRPGERALLTRVVDLMASLELRFIQEKAEDGQLVYRLDPPIDVFVTYDGKRASDISVSRYAVRHLIAEEIDARIARHHSEVVESSKNHARRHLLSQGATTEDATPANKKAKVDVADRPPVDFFGRPIVTKPKSSSTKGEIISKATDAPLPFKVKYRFAEGNSAAVRRNTKMSSFL